MTDLIEAAEAHIAKRAEQGAHTVKDEFGGFNGWLAVNITNMVGTMWCAYAFTILTLISLPEAIRGGTATLISWIAQTFLQLVLLSIIMVGQKVQASASDKQAYQTYKDAEQLLALTAEIHKLVAADVAMTRQVHALLEKTGAKPD